MKAVLISIRPKWCEMIASGKKTVEVRKSRPKLEPPFKCYIYCTKPSKAYQTICGCIVLNSDELFRHPRNGIKYGDSIELMAEDDYTKDNFLNGKVIGEFVCDGIAHIQFELFDDSKCDGDGFYQWWECSEEWALSLDRCACLTDNEFFDYLGTKGGYGWHISNLVFYDEPKQLSDFRLYNTSAVIEDGLPMPTHKIRRPPLSWMYVEKLP
jgi:predicted transcriptional regulator